MKIAQIAPLMERVPPSGYGGTERVVSYLTEALCSMGHDVTLYASGDSITRARLVPVCPRSLRLEGKSAHWLAYHLYMVELVFSDLFAYDILHFHIDLLHYSLARKSGAPTVTTLHGRLDLPEIYDFATEFRDIPVVSISDAQRIPLPGLNWQSTVFNGLPEDLYTFSEAKGEYLAFIGRISPEKGVDKAIEIAVRAGMPLKIAAKIDPADERYFHEHIAKLLYHPLVEYLGEVGEEEKNRFLGNARALLFPIAWPEPFGMVLIEAMACGTPVIAFPGGSVPEIIEHGSNGFVVQTIEQAVQAVEKVASLDRKVCRKVFEQRFSAELMAEKYLRVYDRIAGFEQRTSRRELMWNESSALTTSTIS
ncbi:MAG: glycosyltransferase family 4 protein [Desulfovibrionales bacterium]